VRSTFSPRVTALLVALVLTTALFVLGGCSTLGIATTGQMEGVYAWQDSVGRVLATTSNQASNSNARLANLDSVERRLNTLEVESRQALDTLQFRLDRARDWAQELDIDRIARDAAAVEAAALSASRRSTAFTDAYLQHLISQRKALQGRIDQILTTMDSLRTLDAAAAPEPSSPAVTGTEPAGTEGE
jgi:hypothetical protein